MAITELQLAEWRREVAALYAAVRSAPPREGWDLWRSGRERLFLTHPQSPLPPERRDMDDAPRYFDYDEAWRRRARVEAAEPLQIELPNSGSETVRAVRFGVARIDGLPPLTMFWLCDYAGGVFLSFRDKTSGHTTYGGGRYVLDTAKGADLGGDAETVMVDFNFAYQPSCSYDPRWECPLPPRDNWLSVAVEAGERHA